MSQYRAAIIGQVITRMRITNQLNQLAAKPRQLIRDWTKGEI